MSPALRPSVVGGTHALRRAALLLLSGLLLSAPATALAQTQDTPASQAAAASSYRDYVAEAARRFGVPEAWIRAVMRVESRGDVRAISPKGAMGLMQIMPATWSDLRARHGLGNDPYDPRDNILAGAAYLRELHDRYGSPGFLAAYNAGPGRYEEYRATGRPLPAETRAYVAMLAPLVGGDELAAPVTVAAADPLAWTRAPLFIASAGGAANADVPQDDRAPAAPSSPRSARETAPADPQTGGLFAIRTASAAPQ